MVTCALLTFMEQILMIVSFKRERLWRLPLLKAAFGISNHSPDNTANNTLIVTKVYILSSILPPNSLRWERWTPMGKICVGKGHAPSYLYHEE